MANIDIKELAKKSNVKLWQVADRLGLTDITFSKKLRKELSKEEKENVKSIIEELKNNSSK